MVDDHTDNHKHTKETTMKRKLFPLVLAMILMVSGATVSLAAHGVTCEVKSIDNTTVVLDCKDAGKLKAGAKVEVKAKRKAIEGC